MDSLLRLFSKNNTASAPIPEILPVDGWKTLPIEECGEPLVPLGAFSKYPQIFSDGIYFGEGTSSPYKTEELNGALITPFVREGVAKKLAHASSLLPEGCAFLVWDSYRPLSVQRALYDDYHQQLMKKEGLDTETASVKAQRFVSIPSSDPTRPPPHNTGASIDLTIVKFSDDAWKRLKKLEKTILKSEDWQKVYNATMERQKILHEEGVPLNMGTAFDEVSAKTATRYYEDNFEGGKTLSSDDRECLENRRLLVSTMQKAGFGNYAEEWWHFDCQNQFHAKRDGVKAIYGAATFSEECQAWEDMRKGHYLGNVIWQQQKPVSVACKLGEDPIVSHARSVALSLPDIRHINHDIAKRLEV